MVPKFNTFWSYVYYIMCYVNNTINITIWSYAFLSTKSYYIYLKNWIIPYPIFTSYILSYFKNWGSNYLSTSFIINLYTGSFSYIYFISRFFYKSAVYINANNYGKGFYFIPLNLIHNYTLLYKFVVLLYLWVTCCFRTASMMWVRTFYLSRRLFVYQLIITFPPWDCLTWV